MCNLGVFSVYGIIMPVFRHNYITEFDKKANSVYIIVVTPISYKLVWRLSEFAFFVRLLR